MRYHIVSGGLNGPVELLAQTDDGAYARMIAEAFCNFPDVEVLDTFQRNELGYVTVYRPKNQ